MREGMARAIYFGLRGFAARLEMLEAAIQHAPALTEQEAEFIKEGVKKARMYAAFRRGFLSDIIRPLLECDHRGSSVSPRGRPSR